MKRIIGSEWELMHETHVPPTARAALALYTVRDALTQNRAATLRRVYDLGFRAVETAGFGAELPSAASADELAQYGLGVVSSYFVGDSTRFPEHLDEQQHYGNETIVLGLDASYFKDTSGVRSAINLVNELSEQCSRRSMRLGYHNHPWEVNRLENGQSALELMVAELRPEVFLEFDFYWAEVGGLSIDEASGIARSRIERLHLKDGPLTDTQDAAVFGEGAFDIPGAIHAAADATLHVIAFDEFHGDLLETSGADLRYLQDNHLSLVGDEATD
jgi:sugar phosphate isomerase/epimerase